MCPIPSSHKVHIEFTTLKMHAQTWSLIISMNLGSHYIKQELIAFSLDHRNINVKYGSSMFTQLIINGLP